jgi:hypothetical protein
MDREICVGSGVRGGEVVADRYSGVADEDGSSRKIEEQDWVG